jgi:hypothetical protein
MNVPDFNSINEPKKAADKRRYHNNNDCTPARAIPQKDRRAGTAGYTLCEVCKSINAKARRQKP